MEWNEKQENELKELLNSSKKLYMEYHKLFLHYSNKRDKYRIPIIIFSSIVGVINLTNMAYIQKKYYIYISIFSGLMSITISILASIEQFKKIGENMNKSMNSYLNFKTLYNEILLTISISSTNRKYNGIDTIRYFFNKYQKYFLESPIPNVLPEDFVMTHKLTNKIEKNNSIENIFDENKPVIFDEI